MTKAKSPMKPIIYVPMTCNILVPGHLKLINKLYTRGEVIIGLLSSKALKGYKKERMSFKDREYLLYHLIDNMAYIIKQDSLDPTENLKKYQCTHLASGDGFEKIELEAVKNLGIKKINVKSGHKLHASNVK